MFCWFLAYSSHIPTPGGPMTSFSSSSSSNHGQMDQSSAGAYAYSPSIHITPVTPSAQYAPMSTSLGSLFILYIEYNSIINWFVIFSTDFDSISNNDWHTEGLYIRIKLPIDDGIIHVGMIGIIQSLSVSNSRITW